MTEQEKILVSFTALFQEAKEVQFDFSWSDRAGHFQPAVCKSFGTRDVLLRAETPGHRRILILVQPLGNTVLYDRYVPSDKRRNYIAYDDSTTVLSNNEDERVMTLKIWDVFIKDYTLRKEVMALA